MSDHVALSVDGLFPSVKYVEVPLEDHTHIAGSSVAGSKTSSIEVDNQVKCGESMDIEKMACLGLSGSASPATVIKLGSSSSAECMETSGQEEEIVPPCSAHHELHITIDDSIKETDEVLDAGDICVKQPESVVVPLQTGSKPATTLGVAECRICQEEDDIANLESPCTCSGSLKYAHRKCVQHWCNEKGDTTCEICQKPFESGYAPPQSVRADSVQANISMGWDIPSGQPRLFALAADPRILEGEYDDYASSQAHTAACFRSVALILVALLLFRHIISMTGVGEDEDLTTFFVLSLVRAAGFLIPCYIIARAMNALQVRRQQQMMQEAALASAAEVAYLFHTGRVQGIVAAESP